MNKTINIIKQEESKKHYTMLTYMRCEFCRKMEHNRKLKMFDTLLYCDKCLQKVLKLYGEGMY